MGVARLPFQSRGVGNGLRRVGYILERFGLSPRKIEDSLNSYVDATEEFGCRPTFPITAVTLRRHAQLVRRLSQRGVEFAIHGYIHNDFRQLAGKEQARQIEKAAGVFEGCGVAFRGFRAPYLRRNDETLEALSHLGFLYDSSDSVCWDVLDKTAYPPAAWKEYERVLRFYAPRRAEDYLALPRSMNGLVRIPVSLPEDEALVDRLGISDGEEIGRIWSQIADETYRRGELFTVQLHHERVSLGRAALEAVFSRVRRLTPPVWAARLADIAQWWKERERFSFRVVPLGGNRYAVSANCSERATILAHNCSVQGGAPWWSPACYQINARDFVVEAARPPVIGVAPGSPSEAVGLLRSEGYVVEHGRQAGDCGLYLANLDTSVRGAERAISEAVSNSGAPLIQFWRWPGGARSALAVTGDIDSITLVDFVWRLLGA